MSISLIGVRNVRLSQLTMHVEKVGLKHTSSERFTDVYKHVYLDITQTNKINHPVLITSIIVRFVNHLMNIFELHAPCQQHVYRICYPIKNYRRLSPNYRGERWAYVHFIGGAANYSIIYP